MLVALTLGSLATIFLMVVCGGSRHIVLLPMLVLKAVVYNESRLVDVEVGCSFG